MVASHLLTAHSVTTRKGIVSRLGLRLVPNGVLPRQPAGQNDYSI
jgi:hypothetical protein